MAVEAFLIPGSALLGLWVSCHLCQHRPKLLIIDSRVNQPECRFRSDHLGGGLSLEVYQENQYLAQADPQYQLAGGKMQMMTAAVRVCGKSRTCVDRCRPAGIVEIDGKRVDVVTGRGFVARGTTVEVISVQGNRVVVRPIRIDENTD